MALADIARLRSLTPDRARTIRARILATEYDRREPTTPEMQQSTGMPEELRVPLVARALSKNTHPASGLALLFQHQLPVPVQRIDQAVGAEARAWLTDAGIIEASGNELRSSYRLFIADGVFIWSDAAGAEKDAVMHPGPTTLALMSVLPLPLSGSFLDVGTGPGSLALLAASFGADRAVGTDISERAVSLARFNAAFNELPLEVMAGDLFAPVGRERFDWIVAQPPYVTHPPDEPGVTFLHGGAMGDELAMRLCGGIPAHLRPGGIALVLFDSPVRRSATLHDRVREALGPHHDLIVFSQPGLLPDRQALGYAALADPTFGPRYAEAAIRYRDHLEKLRITDLTHSLVVVRAPEGPEHDGWTMTLAVAEFPKQWDEVRAFMRGVDLSVMGEDALSACHVRPREGATVVIERKPGSDRESETRSIRFARPGIALDRELTQAGAVIFDLLAAESSVSSAIDRFAAVMERPAADVRPLVTSFVRDCLIRALLVPD